MDEQDASAIGYITCAFGAFGHGVAFEDGA